MSESSFLKEVKDAVIGRVFNKPKRRKKIHKTPEQIYEEELNKDSYEKRKV